MVLDCRFFPEFCLFIPNEIGRINCLEKQYFDGGGPDKNQSIWSLGDLTMHKFGRTVSEFFFERFTKNRTTFHPHFVTYFGDVH